MARRRRRRDLDEGYSSDSGDSVTEAPAAAEAEAGRGAQRSSWRRNAADDNDDDATTTSTRGLFRPQAFVPAQSSAADEHDKEGGSSSEDEDDVDEEEDQDEAMQVDEQDPEQEQEQEDGDEFQPASFYSSRSSRGGIGSAAQRGGIGSKRDAGSSAPTFRPGIGSTSSSDAAQQQEDEQGEPHPGIGSGRPGIGSARPGIGSSTSNPGIGSARPGIGSSSFTPQSDSPGIGSMSHLHENLPSSFGAESLPSSSSSSSNRKRASFLPTQQPTTSIQFGAGLGGGFNPAAYLASMGWTGGGLGTQGEGMVNPIEVQLRPERAGLAFGGRKERTKAERAEAKRRGEVQSDEEDAGGPSNRKKQAPKPWTRPPPSSRAKPRKPKIEHRTYQEIIEEAGGHITPTEDIVIDARTGESRQVSSIAQALSSHPVPSSDSTLWPELRHNLRLISDNAKQTLDALAKDGAGIHDRRRWVKRELEEATRRTHREAAEIEKLTGVLDIAKQLETRGRQTMSQSEASLEDAFADLVVGDQGVQTTHTEADIQQYNLDEALVGAIAPLFKRVMAQWQPLEEPGILVDTLQAWSKALRLRPQDALSESRHLNGHSGKSSSTTTMLPVESLLWHTWMPRVRSALNNDWKAHHPRGAVELLSTWRPILPQYLWDNILDQILLPKLKRAVDGWDHTHRVSLHHILFPWLPVLGDRIDEVMSEGKRSMRSMIKVHSMGKSRDRDERLASDLTQWREFYSKSEWDSMMLSLLIPRLSSYLKSTLRINPASQDMRPLETTFVYFSLLRRTYFSRLLEETVFPKWLDTLHSWLVQKSVDVGQVAEWYTWWKAWFVDKGVQIDDDEGKGARWQGVHAAFQVGINLINDAISMDDEERATKLRKPAYKPLKRSEYVEPSSTRSSGKSMPVPLPGVHTQPSADAEEASFKTILESIASSHDLILMPLNRVHSATGLKMYKLSDPTRGTSQGGVAFYIEDDVVWIEERDAEVGGVEYRPVDVEEAMRVAKLKSGGRRRD